MVFCSRRSPMNFRPTPVLPARVVFALGGLAWVALSPSDKSTSPSTEGYVLKALRAANVTSDKVTAIEIERPGQSPEKIAFARDGKAWKMTAPGNARVESSAVDAVVSG